ncbi:hypothetical protein P6U16_22590 (plasmid) [Rhizobium sp. 32-5/1]|uniref:hypothetical protein n=1 Tax=Rhizobium sp. 32-5/1 TaxID=3019602 RepID=UPI00240E722B|nr:hypothetical protein [Rhizobium sp. 32-5/1]WEZ85809.1 hypothetical protein P6U16_22590 [Rhizobium sp. 32-5/1]
MTTELLHDKKDFHKVRSIINPYLFDPELPPSIMYSYAAAAFRDGLFGVCYKHLRPIALKFPRCVEFNMLAAEAALRCGKVDFAKACAKRVLSVRSNNRRARDIFEDAIIALGLAADVSIAVGLPALEE